MNVRERSVVVLTTVSVLATVGLGSAAAYSLARQGSTTVTLQGGTALTGAAGTPAGPVATSAPGATAAASAAAAAAASGAGTTSTTTTHGGGGSAPVAGVNNTQNFVHNGQITVGGIFDESGPLD